MPHAAAKVSNRRRTAIAGLILILLLGVAAAMAGAEHAAAARKPKILGATKRTPHPLCPKECRATGSVTGFGVIADGKRGLYKARATGHIVAWAVDLSKPTKHQYNSFGELFKDPKFGTAPQARLAILKRKGKHSRYTLAKQSPIVPLKGSLGEKPIFTLGNPLRIKKGRIVALTLPTWAPLYRDGLKPNKNMWKASRKPDHCSAPEVTKARPHLRKGQTRTYGCKLEGERILYWAYFVPEKK